jgi:hypothetical protein
MTTKIGVISIKLKLGNGESIIYSQIGVVKMELYKEVKKVDSKEELFRMYAIMS